MNISIKKAFKKFYLIKYRYKMNKTNLTLIVPDGFFASGQILGYFIIPITAAINSLAYFFYGFIIWKKKLIKQLKYEIIFCRVINVTVINLLFIGFQNNGCSYCLDRVFNTYLSQVYSIYSLKYVFHVFSMSHVLLDILVSYERCCVLRNHKSSLFKMPFKYIYIGTIVFSALSRIPDYLSYEIKYSTIYAAYYIALTPVGNTKWYFLYQIIFVFVFFCLCMFIFCVFSIINIILYKRWANNKTKMMKDGQRIKKSEAKFTRMVIFSTIIEIAAVLYNLIAFALTTILLFEGIIFNSFANLNQGMSYEIILIAWTIDVYLYFSMDRNLENVYKKLFFWKKTISNAQTNKSKTKLTTY